MTVARVVVISLAETAGRLDGDELELARLLEGVAGVRRRRRPGSRSTRSSRVMGTSVQMIDRTYGHLSRDHAAGMRDLLNRRPSLVADDPELDVGD
jgi:hypothetical protein